jgi:hypothetical protein
MYDATAQGVESLLDSLDNEAASAVASAVLRPAVIRLAEIDSLLDKAESGPTKAATVKAAEEKGISTAEYEKARDALDAAYSALFLAVHGTAITSEADRLKAEAAKIAATIKPTIIMIEKALGETGFVNKFLALVPKPEGSRLRSSYKNF